MIQREPQKVIKVGDSLALIVPAVVARDLDIERGAFFELVIGNRNTLIFRRVNIIGEGIPTDLAGEQLPVMTYGQ